jgi:hypothetical protein
MFLLMLVQDSASTGNLRMRRHPSPVAEADGAINS